MLLIIGKKEQVKIKVLILVFQKQPPSGGGVICMMIQPKLVTKQRCAGVMQRFSHAVPYMRHLPGPMVPLLLRQTAREGSSREEVLLNLCPP